MLAHLDRFVRPMHLGDWLSAGISIAQLSVAAVSVAGTSDEFLWTTLPIAVAAVGVLMPARRFARTRDIRRSRQIRRLLWAACVLAGVCTGITIATRIGAASPWFDLATCALIVVQFFALMQVDECVQRVAKPRIKKPERKRHRRLRLVAAAIAAVVVTSSEAMILFADAPAGPGLAAVDVNEKHSDEPELARHTTRTPQPRESSSTSAVEDRTTRARIAGTFDTEEMSADEYCGTDVTAALSNGRFASASELLDAVVARGVTWAGCPTGRATPSATEDVWMLMHPDPAVPAGLLYSSLTCDPVVIAPDLVDLVRAMITDGELACAQPWSVSEPARFQMITDATLCTVYLQRDVRADFRPLPGPVAEVAARFAGIYGGRPYVKRLTASDTIDTYTVSIDQPDRNRFDIAEIDVEFDERSYVATTLSDGAQFSTRTCPLPWELGLVDVR